MSLSLSIYLGIALVFVLVDITRAVYYQKKLKTKLKATHMAQVIGGCILMGSLWPLQLGGILAIHGLTWVLTRGAGDIISREYLGLAQDKQKDNHE